jgi:transcriptional regulator with XRE-family HTH domain
MRIEKRAAKNFGRRIKELRVLRGWSQEELATEADISKNYIGEIERGENNVSMHYIARLAHAFDLSLADLFSGL